MHCRPSPHFLQVGRGGGERIGMGSVGGGGKGEGERMGEGRSLPSLPL